MRRLRRYALAVPILILATACNQPIPGAKKTLTAAEAAAPEAADVPQAPTTAAVGPPMTPPTTPASSVVPTTTVRRVTTTVAAAPRTPPLPPPPPPLPGQVVSPATMLAVTTTATEGTTTANLKAVREQYLGEKVLVEVTVSSMERITSITIDFGDGHVVTVPQTQRLGLPPQHGAALRSHVYPAAGRYRITATVTVVPGTAFAMPPAPPTELSWIATGPEHTVTVATDLLQRPDAAPPTFFRLPLLVDE